MENNEIKSQLLVELKRVSGRLQRVKDTLDRWQSVTAERLRHVRYRSEDDLREELRTAIMAANERITRLRSQVASGSKQVKPYFQKVQDTAVSLGKRAVDELEIARQEWPNRLRRIRIVSRGAADEVNERVSRLGLRLAGTSKMVAANLEMALSTITNWGRVIVDLPKRLRETRRARETDLRDLLARSVEPLAVTDESRRLVAANPSALDLFGISDFNMKHFTIDAFLAKAEIPDIHTAVFLSAGQGERLRLPQCMIRRLDGRLRVAQYQLVSEILPHRHLYKFQNVGPYKLTPVGSYMKNEQQTALRLGEGCPVPTSNSAPPRQKVRRHGVRHAI